MPARSDRGSAVGSRRFPVDGRVSPEKEVEVGTVLREPGTALMRAFYSFVFITARSGRPHGAASLWQVRHYAIPKSPSASPSLAKSPTVTWDASGRGMGDEEKMVHEDILALLQA